MTARRPSFAELPGWPRCLTLDQAAAYTGVPLRTFEAEVEQGLWPKPLLRRPDGRAFRTWDRAALDRALDLRSGLVAQSGGEVTDLGRIDWTSPSK